MAASSRQFVIAVARSMAILRSFECASGPLGNGEIARRTGLPKATVSRLTFTLATLGYLTYSQRAEKYSLGPSALFLGQVYLNGQWPSQYRTTLYARVS
jgi:DNA-binding IclR family transcriptional regulator